MEQYIKVYVWILTHPELTRIEALLISEIMRWPNGCWKSSRQLAWLIKTDTRTIQRSIKSLEKRQWLAILPDDKKQMRILYATPKEPPIGPLFEYNEKAQTAIQKHMKNQVNQLIEQTAKNMGVK